MKAILLFGALGVISLLASSASSAAERTAVPRGATVAPLTAPQLDTLGTKPPGVALTKDECRKLGGVIDASDKACTDQGYFTCSTSGGSACIDNK